jgi:hypothetical protein
MGKLNLGILGGFSGKVGTVIGSGNRKGDDIIRAKSKKPRPASTLNQQRQQVRFKLVTTFVQGLSPVIKSGLKQVAGVENISPFNYACRHILNNAMAGTADSPEIDFSKVILSDGKLSRIAGLAVVMEDGKAKFTWPDDVEASIGELTDKVTLVVYNASNSELSYSMGEVARTAKTASLALPYNEAGDDLICYLFFQSSANPQLVSTSQYVSTLIA